MDFRMIYYSITETLSIFSLSPNNDTHYMKEQITWDFIENIYLEYAS
jgi:hypothetical protein